MNENDIAEIVKKNPHIDGDDLKKGLDALDQLDENGIEDHGYSLAIPFSGKWQWTTNTETDRRGVNLDNGRGGGRTHASVFG